MRARRSSNPSSTAAQVAVGAIGRAADRITTKGAMMHAAMVDTASVLGLEAASPVAAITLAEQLLPSRPMPGLPRQALLGTEA